MKPAPARPRLGLAPHLARRLSIALGLLLLAHAQAWAETTAPRSQSRLAQAQRVETTATRLCARQAGDARRACEQHFATEAAALRAPPDETPAGPVNPSQ